MSIFDKTRVLAVSCHVPADVRSIREFVHQLDTRDKYPDLKIQRILTMSWAALYIRTFGKALVLKKKVNRTRWFQTLKQESKSRLGTRSIK